MTNRRTFMIQCSVAGTALAAGQSMAQGAAVSETDPQAASLGYKADAGKVDKAKFPKFAAGQQCANCQLFQGKTAATGPCTIFANKTVSAKGWCSAWVKKA